VAVVDHGGRHQAEPGMMMLVVVPGEKRLAEPARVFDGAEAGRPGYRTRADYSQANGV